ncbi:hypothetical protein EDB84DRAFT_1565608 [Lactarius hengduanensis]|nr:hypothetical protein EDB84DRAFT_1565608 [Lactarius hengduanensis]
MPATFEIPVGPTITENLHTFRTPGSNRQLTEDPATSHRYGSITHDRKRGKMTLEWANEEDFLAWLAAEESDQTIELITILGKYENEHDHPLDKTRDLVMQLVHIGVDTKAILKRVRESTKRTDRDHYITTGDINRLRRIVENEDIRLDENDAVSIKVWATRLQQAGDSFIMCIQTEFQKSQFREIGNNFISIDATHNTTQYAWAAAIQSGGQGLLGTWRPRRLDAVIELAQKRR